VLGKGGPGPECWGKEKPGRRASLKKRGLQRRLGCKIFNTEKKKRLASFGIGTKGILGNFDTGKKVFSSRGIVGRRLWGESLGDLSQ